MRDSYHHGDLRTALIAAVVALARESGLASISLRSVARRVGVSEASPYHHFANKAELLGAAAACAFDEFGETLRRAVTAANDADDDPAIALAAAYVSFALLHPGQYQLMFGRHIIELGIENQADAAAAGRAAMSTSIDAIRRSLDRRGAAGTDVDDVFRIAWALLHGCVDLVAEGELAEVDDVDRAVDMAQRGLDALLAGLGRPASGMS